MIHIEIHAVTNVDLHGYVMFPIPLYGASDTVNGVVHELKFCRKCNANERIETQIKVKRSYRCYIKVEKLP
jgi:hypothetical protein